MCIDRAVRMLLLGLLTAGPVGCSYSLPPFDPPSHLAIKVLARAPQLYTLQLNTGQATDYPVPSDGMVTVSIPGSRRSCIVRLFGEIKVSGGESASDGWTLTINSDGKARRRFSIKELNRLETDSSGYRLLKVKD